MVYRVADRKRYPSARSGNQAMTRKKKSVKPPKRVKAWAIYDKAFNEYTGYVTSEKGDWHIAKSLRKRFVVIEGEFRPIPKKINRRERG